MSAREVARVMEDIARSARTEDIPGCWPGRVEDVDDPIRMNRVRVRVYAFHGTKENTPTKALPWAELMSSGGGGYDYGSAGQEYPVGSNVWVMFALGKVDHPVVMGGLHSKTRVKDDLNDGQILTLDGVSESGADEAWIPSEDEELAKDVFEDFYQNDNHPTATVWKKSFKGHTILVEDRDEFEFLKIIDRAGQVIEMNCPVTAEKNLNNAEQRGTRSSVKDSQLLQDYLVNGRAFIRLKDVAGQEVILDGKANGETIKLISRNRLGSSKQVITLSSGKGKEFIEILDKQGNRIKLDPNGTVPIVIEDFTGSKIEFDAETGEVRTTASSKKTEAVVGDLTAEVGGSRNEVVGGDDITKIVGKKVLSIVSDLAASVGGLTSLALTGPVQIQIANALLPTGTPSPTGLSLELVLGNIDVSSKVGSQTFNAPLGVHVKGAVSSSESAVLGDTLSNALQELSDIFTNNAASFGIGNMGSPVPINPAVITAITAWAIKYISVPATNIVSQLHTVSRL